MTLNHAKQNIGLSIKLISLLASLILHAAILATVALIIGESGSGPAESSSTLHVSVERVEPTDEYPKDNPAPDISEQTPKQPETIQPEKQIKIVNKSQPGPNPLKIKVVPIKELPQQQPKATPPLNQYPSSKPTSNKKGADVTEERAIQLAKEGNHSRLSRDYQSRLQRLVERHKYYPLQARRKGAQGKATVSFTVRRDGKIENIVLSRSSGKSILDQAAISTIKRISKAPPFPNSIKRSKWRFDMPITYNLR